MRCSISCHVIKSNTACLSARRLIRKESREILMELDLGQHKAKTIIEDYHLRYDGEEALLKSGDLLVEFSESCLLHGREVFKAVVVVDFEAPTSLQLPDRPIGQH